MQFYVRLQCRGCEADLERWAYDTACTDLGAQIEDDIRDVLHQHRLTCPAYSDEEEVAE